MARAIRPKELTGDPWDALTSVGPDIALLQEVRKKPDSAPGALHLLTTKQGWGTGIWSNLELSEKAEILNPEHADYPTLRDAILGYSASANVLVREDRPISVMSIHAYPAEVKPEYLIGFSHPIKSPSAKMLWPGEIFWWLTKDLPQSGRDIIIGGDWNAALLFDKVYGPRGNEEFFDKMRAAGWRDALKKFQPNETQTYFRKGRHPYQLDHVFLSEALYDRLVNASVDISDTFLSCSDHAPLVLDFKD